MCQDLLPLPGGGEFRFKTVIGVSVSAPFALFCGNGAAVFGFDRKMPGGAVPHPLSAVLTAVPQILPALSCLHPAGKNKLAEQS